MLTEQWTEIGGELAVELGGEEGRKVVTGNGRATRGEEAVEPPEGREAGCARRAAVQMYPDLVRLLGGRFTVRKRGEELVAEMVLERSHYPVDDWALSLVAWTSRKATRARAMRLRTAVRETPWISAISL